MKLSKTPYKKIHLNVHYISYYLLQMDLVVYFLN